ncbi:sensor domain-containing diguanylate cyclase [Sporolactobacillus vineae]|uniref:sensor domain-containing diguanylate cyclase n=1 Tax=Sporolactobacillus vineae TaxID=444463 RepID=UPI000289FB16|nr:diguanylate cyclase [Sporolactobacillus vineae]
MDIEIDDYLPEILNFISEGIVILDSNLTIAYWNPLMEKLTRYSQKQVLDRNIGEVIPALKQNTFHQAMTRVCVSGMPAFFSAGIHRRILGDHHPVNLKMNRILHRKDKLILMEFIDMTNQFLQIDQLRASVRRQAELNNRLKQKEQVIEKLAYYDQLTGVANRALFDKYADLYLNRAVETGSMLGLMFVDVNEFKQINDTYGHNTGDKVMTRVAGMLTESMRKDDVVCRYGGDEFLVLMPDVTEPFDDQNMIRRIGKNKKKPLIQDGFEIILSLSIGVSLFPRDGRTIDQLVAKADERMYLDKHQSRTDADFGG